MNPWGYKNYRDSVSYDMKKGQEEMGFNSFQSFGYAHNELAVRLEEFPNETPLALIGLAIRLCELSSLNELESDEGFILELKENLDVQAIEVAVKCLSAEDRELFIADLEMVRSLMNW